MAVGESLSQTLGLVNVPTSEVYMAHVQGFLVADFKS